MSKEAKSAKSVENTLKPGFGSDYTIDVFVSFCSCGRSNCAYYDGSEPGRFSCSCGMNYIDGPYIEKTFIKGNNS